MNNLTLVLGGPGCGKTTKLLSIVEERLAAGIPAQQIAFVAFTKAAATEARERAAVQFSLDAEKDLPWFRTIHSLAYSRLGIARDEVMDRRDWAAFSHMVGEVVNGGETDSDQPIAGMTNRGDQMLRIVEYAATSEKGLDEAWSELDEPVDWHQLKRFDAALARYKSEVGKLGFTDMLLSYAREGEPTAARVALIDEAQDLTRAQWNVVERAFSEADEVYVGGDDDQAIYRWAGADVERFLSLSRAPVVLPVSHRLPAQIFSLASRVASRISRRYAKVFTPTTRAGTIERYSAPDHVDLREGTWLLLARNGYMLSTWEEVARAQGVSYSVKRVPAVKPEEVAAMKLWERMRSGKQRSASAREIRALAKMLERPIPALRETIEYTQDDFADWPWALIWHRALTAIPFNRREYYIACLRRGERLSAEPRVRIDTIHGVKGAEADHVALMVDMSARTYRGYEVAPDAEHRVYYVAVTRARKSLHLITPQSSAAYPL